MLQFTTKKQLNIVISTSNKSSSSNIFNKKRKITMCRRKKPRVREISLLASYQKMINFSRSIVSNIWFKIKIIIIKTEREREGEYRP